MTSDLDLQSKEEEAHEQNKRAIAYEAAAQVVVLGASRSEALESAYEIIALRSEIPSDETATIETLAEAQLTTVPQKLQRQVLAVAHELYAEM